MGLDIRIPIGSLFALLGVLLGGCGVFSDPAAYQRSLGINIDLWWGAVLLGFGLAMLGLAWRAAAVQSRASRVAGTAVRAPGRVEPT